MTSLSQRFPIILTLVILSAYKADLSEFNECSCLKGAKVDKCEETHFKEVSDSHFILPLANEAKSWSQAKASCESFGAELAESSNYADHLALRKAADNEEENYWVGVVKKSSGKFSYSDGITPISFSPRIASDRDGECVYITTVEKDIMYNTDDCLEQKPYICQYKRDSLCYMTHNSDWEGLRDTILPDSGLFVSFQQKPWADAEFDCKQHGMQLLTAEEKVKSHLPALLGKLKSSHFMREVWTAGHFSTPEYRELKWSTNNKVVKDFNSPNWNPLGTEWEEKEPLDKSGMGLDLCLLMNIQKDETEVTWSAENCLIPKYYICMAGLHSGKPRSGDENLKGGAFKAAGQEGLPESFMEYCNGDEKVQMTKESCPSNLIISQKPDCICFRGLHGVTDHDSCKSSLYSGESCVSLTSTEDVHWKILKPLPAAPFVYLQTRNLRSGNYIQWSNMMKESMRQLLGPTTIFYSGVKVFKLNKNTFCFERKATVNPDQLSTISQITTQDIVSRVFYTHMCVGMNLTEYSGADIQTETNPITSQCSLSCSGGSPISNDDSSILPATLTTPEKPNMETERERQKALSTLLVQDAIDSSFPDYKNDNRNSQFKPQRSFKLLEKLFEIAKNVCINIVSADFLKKGLDLFKVLHYGKMYEYGEYFSERETKKIDELLDKCLAEQEVAQVRIDKCTGQVTHIEANYPNGTLDVHPVDITGYGALIQHHIPELTWNVIDIMNVVCLRSFRSSYLLYHNLEQGMESLFTNEIRKLWHHPMIEADMYKQILGADELTNMINLRSCADSVYQRHYLVSRLERPKAVGYREFKGSSSTNSTSGVDKTKPVHCSAKTQCKM